MAEPVQGIRAIPDDNNARYFHVVVAGPGDVSHKNVLPFYLTFAPAVTCIVHTCIICHHHEYCV